MKSSQIIKLLKGVIDDLCKSIIDEKVINIIKQKSFITGGCIPSMILNEWVNDYDFYLEDGGDVSVLKDYFANNNKDGKYKTKLITDNSINLDNKVQIVTKWYGCPDVITKNFDWAHIKGYYKYPDILIIPNDTYRLLIEKELIYTGSKYPMSSLFRLKKFIKKGWNVSTKTMLHIILDVVQAFKNPNKPAKSNEETYEDMYNDDYQHCFDIEEILYHLNGVDPLTIQVELEKKTGMSLTISEILNLINK